MTIFCLNQKEIPHRRVPGKDHISKISPFWEHVMVFKKFGDHEDLLETYQNLYFLKAFDIKFMGKIRPGAPEASLPR